MGKQTKVQKLNSWEKAKELNIIRSSPCGLYCNEILDKGVNYFILALEYMGCITQYSCEGHFGQKNKVPQFYISFKVPNRNIVKQLRDILTPQCQLEYDKHNEYVLRIDFQNQKQKIKILSELSARFDNIL